MHPGLIGGLVGGALGVLGGLIGTYCAIRNTRGPRERLFIIRFACLIWVVVSAFVTLTLFFPGLLRWAIIPYNVLLVGGIIQMNKRQAAIRAAETDTAH